MGRRKRKKEPHRAKKPTGGRARKRLLQVGIPLLLILGLAVAVCFIVFSNTSTPANQAAQATRHRHTLDELLSMTPDELAKVDIAEMDLLCAQGLPGSEDLDIDKCLATLDSWAEWVKFQTERHLYRLTDPNYADAAEHWKHSEARFRAEWLMAVMQRDIGVHYMAGWVPQDLSKVRRKTSKEGFIHGLMDREDAHKAFGGTCASLPIAYVAVGRRLGYPVKVVSAKGHLYCRWDGLNHPNPAWRDRFNFDGAGNGFSIDPDEFYLSWPSKVYPDQVKTMDLFTSLTPQEELGQFMEERGNVLDHVREDYAGALVAYAHAVRLWPENCSMHTKAGNMVNKLFQQRVQACPEAFRQLAERNVAELEAEAQPDQ